MGAARKRRLGLIKGGLAEVAKTEYVKPIRMVTETHLVPPDLAQAITDRYEKAVSDKAKAERLPTRSAFFIALVIAGISSFDRHLERGAAEREAHPLIATPTDAEVIKLG
jgi:hypothetical protein